MIAPPPIYFASWPHEAAIPRLVRKDIRWIGAVRRREGPLSFLCRKGYTGIETDPSAAFRKFATK
jgi:hypothetical protein